MWHLSQAQGEARALAGGTDLLVQMKQRCLAPRLLVDIKAIPELQVLAFQDSQVRIGAAVPLARIVQDPDVRARLPLLVQACSTIGSPQVRNRGTLGGNLCNAAPSADSAPALLVLEARAIIARPGGKREVPLEEFFVGPGQTTLGDGELLQDVIIPLPPEASRACYLTFSTRQAMDLPIAGVAVLLTLSPRGEVREARLALGAVGPVPFRARGVEAELPGRIPRDSAFEEAGLQASRLAQPISDVRASAEYRRELVKVLTHRALRKCLENGKEAP